MTRLKKAREIFNFMFQIKPTVYRYKMIKLMIVQTQNYFTQENEYDIAYY